MTAAATLLTEDQQDQILDALAEGLGWEDIALRNRWPGEAVRTFIFALPAKLRGEIYRKESA